MPQKPLTARQRQVAWLVGQGLDNGAIAAHLGISLQAVKNLVSRSYRRLGDRNRKVLGAYAAPPPDPGATLNQPPVAAPRKKPESGRAYHITTVEELLAQLRAARRLPTALAQALKLILDRYVAPSLNETALQQLAQQRTLTVATGTWKGRLFALAIGEPPSYPITEHQHVMLSHLARGSGNQMVARLLGISVSTVAATVPKIYQRLGISSREQLGAYALLLGRPASFTIAEQPPAAPAGVAP